MPTVQSQFGVTLVSPEVAGAGLELAGTFAGTSSTTAMRISATANFTQADDYWNARKFILIGKSGTNVDVSRRVTDWVQSTGIITFEAFPTAMDANDEFYLKKVVLAEIPAPELGQEMLERNNQRDSLSKECNVPGMYNPSTSLVTEWRGSGTAAGDNFPDFSPILEACGMVESTSGTNSIVYTPVTGGSGNQKSVTIDHYSRDGIHYKYLGCKSDLDLATEMGELPKVTFGIQAYDSTENTAAAPSLQASAWNEVKPKPVLGVTFTLSAIAENISTFNFNIANALTRVGSQSSTSGTTQIIITDRPTTVSFNPEADDTAKFGVWQAGGTRVVSWALGAAGNKQTIRMPAVQYQGVTETDDDGIKRLDMESLATLSAGDDEWRITFE
jgi:hypothetical protein